MRTKKIKIPLYHGQLSIVQVESLSDIEEKYKLSSLKGFEAITFRNHMGNGYSRYVLAFEENTTPNIIAHEALHLVALIYEDRGMILEIENDEPQCYLLGWIVGQCHKFLNVSVKK